jgi:mannosyltransferase
MTVGSFRDNAEPDRQPQADRSRIPAFEVWACAAIAVVAAGLRLYQLGRLSFWYDEVVTMRLARSSSPRALFERLFEIDATRAPLHPFILEFWLKLLGTSEFAARSFSVICGVATIILIYQIGCTAFDRRTGLWAASLAAVSPVLVVYSREARMYAWLVLVSCMCWRLLLALRESFTIGRALSYVLSLTALVYSHPLGLIMLATISLAGLVDNRQAFGGLRRWFAVHAAVAILILPWIHNYIDHPPEFLSDRLPLRFLLGTPIGFIGGNSLLLLGLVALIATGIFDQARDPAAVHRRAVPALLVCWLILPPVALYVYSWLFHPIFGPARYTVFVAPAYLVLVAMGLSRLPEWARYPLGLVLVTLSSLAVIPLAYDPNLKADWRDFAAQLTVTTSRHPDRSIVVIVASADPKRNVEVETARYYLPAGCVAVAHTEDDAKLSEVSTADELYYALGTPASVSIDAALSIGPFKRQEVFLYPGLNVYRFAR